MVDVDQVRAALAHMAWVLQSAAGEMATGDPELIAAARKRVEWVARELEIAAGVPRANTVTH